MNGTPLPSPPGSFWTSWTRLNPAQSGQLFAYDGTVIAP